MCPLLLGAETSGVGRLEMFVSVIRTLLGRAATSGVGMLEMFVWPLGHPNLQSTLIFIPLRFPSSSTSFVLFLSLFREKMLGTELVHELYWMVLRCGT